MFKEKVYEGQWTQDEDDHEPSAQVRYKQTKK